MNCFGFVSFVSSGNIKVILALLCWAMSLPLLLIQPAAQGLTDAALLTFLAILLLSMVRLLAAVFVDFAGADDNRLADPAAAALC